MTAPRAALPLTLLLLLPGCPGPPAEQPVAATVVDPDQRDPDPLAFDGGDGRDAPLSMQLHLHGSLSELDGTMLYHTAEAEALGVDVLYWSDHDALIQMMNRGRGFDFDQNSMGGSFVAADLVLDHGMLLTTDTMRDASVQLLGGGPSGQGYHLRMQGASETDATWRVLRYRYQGDFFSHQIPLLSDATVELEVNPVQALTDDWRFQVVFLLSGNETGGRNSLVYYLATEDLSALSDAETRYLPMSAPEGAWTPWSMPISDDAIAWFPEMDDQSAQTVYLELHARNDSDVSVDVDDLVQGWRVEGEKLREKQAQVLADRYSNGNVTHFVGQEITLVEDGKHVNPLGPGVPMPEYRDQGTLPLADATGFIHDHGGIAVCNHPFGTATRIIAEGEKALDRVDWLLDSWIAADGHGCDAVEVGYRARVVDLDHHLLFWDGLSDERIFVTGIGTSDHHLASPWLEIRNPFLTWIFLDIPTETAVATEIEAGRAFFGDPGPFVGHQPLLDLWSETGAVMGQVQRTDDPQVIHVELGYTEPGWTLALVVDGELYDAIVLGGGEDELVFAVDRAHHRHVRAELWDAQDRPVLLSNPIYSVPVRWRGVIPPARVPPGS